MKGFEKFSIFIRILKGIFEWLKFDRFAYYVAHVVAKGTPTSDPTRVSNKPENEDVEILEQIVIDRLIPGGQEEDKCNDMQVDHLKTIGSMQPHPKDQSRWTMNAGMPSIMFRQEFGTN
jgi:hypothetical protein